MITKEQLEQDFLVIFKNSDKNSKLAWSRKQKKMTDIIDKLQPIEDKLLELLSQKQPLIEEINKLRQIMVKDCPHFEEFLVHHGKSIECKFCNTNISINRTMGKL